MNDCVTFSALNQKQINLQINLGIHVYRHVPLCACICAGLRIFRSRVRDGAATKRDLGGVRPRLG